MGYLIGIPLMALLAALQSSVFAGLRPLDGGVDLVLLAVVAWALAGRAEEAMVWGLVGGFLLDMLSAAPLGVTAIALVAIAFLVSLLEGRFWEAHLLMPAAAVLVASLIYGLIALGAAMVAGATPDLATSVSRVLLPSAFLDVLLALPATQLAESVVQSLFPPEVAI